MSQPTNRPSTSGPSRRAFIGGTAATAAAAGVLAALPEIPAAASVRPGHGSLDDVEHVVILMQENRSFDHYYGTMRGVRGFADRAALTYADGRSVYHQPDPSRSDGGYLLPYHVDTLKTDGMDMGGNDHGWDGVHQQWGDGANDGWIADNGEHTMSYFTRQDVPFNRALAEAFTLCDHYFCSIKGPTTPNRLFHWSGTIDPQGIAGGPAISNPADYNPVFNWTTYPERLQKAGIDWRVYANPEVGDGGGEDGWVGDYGDNPLWLFQAYHDALNSTDAQQRDLAVRASLRKEWLPNAGQGRDARHVLAEFLSDVAKGTLPAVSWVVAPYEWSEHPAARPINGANYVQTVLNAIWKQPELWAKTVVLLNYDEHDGFFDHVISPTAPPGTADEFVAGQPVGLGPRVPMTVVSPWSRGGWINSEVFDHTSVLRFLETWTGVREPNISAWRRTICGDLLSCFDFSSRQKSVPKLPDTTALRAYYDEVESSLPAPAAPAIGKQTVPTQEHGVAVARPLPYQPTADVSIGGNKAMINLGNAGTAAVQLQVYDKTATPLTAQRIDVGPNGKATATVPVKGTYNLAVHGPNGFLREARGDASSEEVSATVAVVGSRSAPRLAVTLIKRGGGSAHAKITGLGGLAHTVTVTARPQTFVEDPLHRVHGWYDLQITVSGEADFLRRFAGHLENGHPSITG